MRTTWWSALALAAAVAGASVARGQQLEGWMRDRDEGIRAAKKSGRPILLSTSWAPGV